MARKLAEVWVLEATLRSKTALHVGGTGGDATADLTVARDGRGRLIIPGTSLAGVLRQVARDLYDVNDVKRLFGFQAVDDGHAAFLRVADAVVEDGTLELRDGVTINREDGAAADDFLFTRQVIAAGATIKLHVEVEVAKDAGDTKIGRADARLAQRVLPGLAAVLEERGLAIGAANSRGLGRLVVDKEGLELRRLDLTQLEHLRAWWQLRAERVVAWPADTSVALAKSAPLSPDLWQFRVRWYPLGPLMVKSGADGVDIDHLPLTTWSGERYHAVLPGSSIKGALRARAERIWRTLLGDHELLPEDPKDQVLFYPKGQEMTAVADLFGRARRKGEKEPAHAALRVADCHHRAGTERSPWEWTGAPDSDGQFPGYHPRARIAVDRWTGGALDSALFTQLEPPWEKDEPGWELLSLDIDLGLIRDDTRKHMALALFWLVLRDLASGDVPLGFGTARGMGAIEVTSITARHEGDEQTELLNPEAGGLAAPEGAWKDHVTSWERTWRDQWSS